MRRKKSVTTSQSLLNPSVPDMSGETWDIAVKIWRENSELLSHRVYSLAAGGLALSFTAISFIVGENKAALGFQAPIIWSLFLLCIILDTISIIVAKNRAAQLEAITSNRIKSGQEMSGDEANKIIDKMNKPIGILNTIVLLLLIITIIWAILYCYCLLLHLS